MGPRIEVACVIRPWGVRGDLYVEPLSGAPGRFERGARLLLRGVPYIVQRSLRSRAGLVLKLQGVDSRRAAEALRGALLEVPQDEAPPLPPDTYYHFQVVGLKAVTTDGHELGEVVEVLATGSNDVYVARGPRGEVLIPAIADVVKAVDLDRGILLVEPVEGLL